MPVQAIVVSEETGEDDQDHDHRGNKDQVVPDVHDSFLEMAPLPFRGLCHQCDGRAKEIPQSGGRHVRSHSFHADDGVCVGNFAHPSVDGHRLSRQPRLVKLKIGTVDQLEIRPNDVHDPPRERLLLLRNLTEATPLLPPLGLATGHSSAGVNLQQSESFFNGELFNINVV
jgi:hypothetical protein